LTVLDGLAEGPNPEGRQVVGSHATYAGPIERDPSAADAMAATTAAPAREPPAQAQELPRRFGLIFAGLRSVMLLASLDQTIVSTALATIVGELHSVNHAGWVTTAPIVAATIAMPITGRPGDLLGRKASSLAASRTCRRLHPRGRRAEHDHADHRPRHPGPGW
jgi:hypothetical protein